MVGGGHTNAESRGRGQACYTSHSHRLKFQSLSYVVFISLKLNRYDVGVGDPPILPLIPNASNLVSESKLCRILLIFFLNNQSKPIIKKRFVKVLLSIME